MWDCSVTCRGQDYSKFSVSTFKGLKPLPSPKGQEEEKTTKQKVPAMFDGFRSMQQARALLVAFDRQSPGKGSNLIASRKEYLDLHVFRKANSAVDLLRQKAKLSDLCSVQSFRACRISQSWSAKPTGLT
jgi:hypothetical protein